jgi:hypothetical protein
MSEHSHDDTHTTETFSIVKTRVFNANIEGHPCVQFIINIFADNRATVKIFLPQYPDEQGIAWLRNEYGEKAARIEKSIAEYIKCEGAHIMYFGY